MEGYMVFGLIVFGFFYFIPTWIAFARGHQSRGGILVLNFFGFFFGIPWIISLVWSLSGVWKRRGYAGLTIIGLVPLLLSVAACVSKQEAAVCKAYQVSEYEWRFPPCPWLRIEGDTP